MCGLIAGVPDEDEASTAASSMGSDDGDRATKSEERAPDSYRAELSSSPFVADLNLFTADRFFLDTSRQMKAVLFTKKAQVPTLWRQVTTALVNVTLLVRASVSRSVLSCFACTLKASRASVCPGL